uniref:Vacuolar protein sorting-associated protein 51 homolog n=1 Tax=Panagrolaimus sp. PS1159 TaxID=55785 RepID=A0AC35FXQ3_9BILA
MESSPEKSQLNLNSSDFDAESYVQNLLQKKGLDELVAIEEDMVQNVRRLDSEMQQLVYENYSKFLTATNTVRNMQTEFQKMSNDMGTLTNKMDKIADLSGSLCNVFDRHRQNVRKLTDASKTVKGLQYIVKLPQRLQNLIDQKDFTKAVSSYIAVKPKLDLYKDVPSMTGICSDCNELIQEVEERLRERLTSRLISSDDLIDAVKMLKELGIPESELETKMVETWKEQIEAELSALKKNEFEDILEFAENGCCNFLTTLSISANIYPQLFAKENNQSFILMIDGFMEEFEKIVNQRFCAEKSGRECALYVRALDRVYRKLAACDRLIFWKDYNILNNDIVVKAAAHQISIGRKNIVSLFISTFSEVMEETRNTQLSAAEILQLIHKLEQNFLVSVKTTLANLLLFTASDITFSSIDTVYFFQSFSRNVYEEIVVGSTMDIQKYSREMINTEASQFLDDSSTAASYAFLILAQFFNIMQKKHISYLIDLCQEQFRLTERLMELTLNVTICERLDEIAKLLLKEYADLKGSEMTELCSKSVNNTDWLKAEEPKIVRNEIKRIIEFVKEVSEETTVFVSDSPRKQQRSPDLGGRNLTPRHIASTSTFETGSLSSALEKMWTEKVEYNTVIDFKQEIILLAIVKIGLKSLVEFSRLLLFSCNGLQQMQVDCLYLKQKLWQYVHDEHVLNSLIDEVVASVVIQCTEPRLLEPSVANLICEKSDI